MATHIESLDARRLFALVTWDGGAGTANWTDAANWSGDVLPGAIDDVTISAGVTVTIPTNTHLNSLAIEGSTVNTAFGQTVDLRFDTSLRVAAGGKFKAEVLSNVTIDGTGNILVEAGGELSVEVLMQYGAQLTSRLPVENHGIVRFRGATFAAGIQNLGTMNLLGSGGLAGALTNEASGIINVVNYSYSPSSSFGPHFEIGLGVTGTNSTSPVINRGIIRSDYPASPTQLPYELGGIDSPLVGLTVYLNSTPTLGGTWGTGGDSVLKFTRRGTNGGNLPVTFDSTFNFEAGTLILSELSATVSGIAQNTGLSLTGNTHAIFADARTHLALLHTQGNASFEIAPGNHKLIVEDLALVNSNLIRINDGLLIHGNNPGYMRPWAAAAAASVPAYASQTFGEYGGSTASLEPNGSPFGLGYSTGAGLASHYPSHVFNGETFDDNDFIFFTTLRGDVNFDRQIDFTDLLTLSQRYGQTTTRGYADGNFEGNVAGSGSVGFEDLLRLAQNYGTPFAKTRGTFALPPKRSRLSDVIL